MFIYSHTKKNLAIMAITFGLAACNPANEQSSSVEKDPLASHIDSTILPKDNFFLFANNTWFKQHPIPSSEKSNGIFQTIQDSINADVREICEQSANNSAAKKGSNEQKIGDFFFSGMDTLSIEKKGLSPLSEQLKRIEGIKSTNDVISVTAQLQEIGVSPLFSFYIGQDQKNSSIYSIYLSQASLGLPEKDYYFNPSERTTTIRNEYVKHIASLFKIMGNDDAYCSSKSQAIMLLETDLAKCSRKMEDLRDPYKNYNKMSVADAEKNSPTLQWSSILKNYKLTNIDTVIVGQPEYYKGLESILKKHDIETWKAYLTFNLIDEFASDLSSGFVKENFHFHSTIMQGVKEEKPRWKKIVESTNGYLGELIGEIYVRDYLPKGAKEKMLEIANNVRSVYAEHIKKLDWMSEPTKEKALVKLNKIGMKIGYPDKWKDLSALEISRESYVSNIIRTSNWHFNYMLQKWGKPVDRSEWNMTPQTYNAYYDPTNNEIVIPACNIIVPGYENKMPDDALLYAIIGGSTIGHEITHGFDDQGSQYDENGNLKNWWTAEDRKKFMEKTTLIVEQFNNYVVLDSLHIKGENTQGENIADLGGAIMGYEAFKKTPQGKSSEKIGGYTPDQRYFLGFGFSWMIQQTDAALANQVMSNEHSPASFRVIGPLSNIPEFYAAFGIKEGDKMHRNDKIRVKIW